MSDLIDRAIRFATEAHERIDQRRQYSGRPYTEHLRNVARLVAEVTDDEAMIAAAWLHDVVEDTPATVEDIERHFGAAVARLVWELTDVSRPGDGNRAARKAIDRAHLAAASPRAQTVKLADLIDNARDITAHDPRFAVTFLEEMAATLDVLTQADPTLKRRARRVLAQCQARLGETPHPGGVEAADPGTWQPFRSQFNHLFSARDIATPIALSFDLATAAEYIRDILTERTPPIATLRRAGQVVGYVSVEHLRECRDTAAALRKFLPGQVIEDSASFPEVILVLTRHDFCFVRSRTEIVGVIGRQDINHPYMRMWLFGIVTLMEMQLNDWLHQTFGDSDAWQQALPEARLRQARHLQEERRRLGQTADLLDCLQLADKATLLLQQEGMHEKLGFPSRRAAKTVIRQFQSLRNHLAHAQDLSRHDWAQIARIGKRLLEG